MDLKKGWDIEWRDLGKIESPFFAVSNLKSGMGGIFGGDYLVQNYLGSYRRTLGDPRTPEEVIAALERGNLFLLKSDPFSPLFKWVEPEEGKEGYWKVSEGGRSIFGLDFLLNRVVHEHKAFLKRYYGSSQPDSRPTPEQNAVADANTYATVPTDAPSDSARPQSPALRVVDVCYRPETGALLLLTDDLMHRIDTDSRLIDEALRALNQAVAAEDERAITEAKAEVMKTLAPEGRSDTGIAGLTELAGYRGRKATYVRSDKIAHHIRRYNLAVTVRNERRFTRADGSFDPAKTQRTLREDYRGGPDKVEFKLDLTEFNLAMNDWARSWNKDVGQKRDWLADSDHFSATTEAAVMRLMAGASLSARISKTAIGLAANAAASAALAEGKVTVESHFPDQDGFALRLELDNKHAVDGTTTLDFGAVRASLILQLIGFAGAKALVCANVELSMEGTKATLKGLTDTEARRKAEADTDFKPHPPIQGGDVGAAAFAGVSGGCGVKGALEWDNPEKRTGDEPVFSAFAEIGGEFNAQAGAGAEAKLYVDFYNGRFMIRSRVGACFGVGAAGAIVATVNVNTLSDFIQCIYHQLMKFDFRKLAFINEEAFKAFHQVISGALQLGEQVFDCLQDTVYDISDWWRTLNLTAEHDEQANQLAENILKDEQGLVQFAPPEAKASILRKLCLVEGRVGNIGWTGFNELREEAVIKVLSTVTCERELVEIVERMGPDGPVHPNKTDWDAWRGFELLTEILDGREQRQFSRWYDQLPKTAAKDVRAEVAASIAQSTVRLA